jgi:hypothetical protein
VKQISGAVFMYFMDSWKRHAHAVLQLSSTARPTGVNMHGIGDADISLPYST